jgi:hypothetical protein
MRKEGQRMQTEGPIKNRKRRRRRRKRMRECGKRPQSSCVVFKI